MFISPNAVFNVGQPIRGGVPICFPWFGPRGGLPSHGFARTAIWAVTEVRDEDEKVEIRLRLTDTDATRSLWPHAFVLEYILWIGSALGMELKLTNTGKSALDFEEALHTYLEVGDVRKIVVSGLADTAYLDKTDAGREKVETSDAITPDRETDRVYLNTQSQVGVHDPALGRDLLVQKSGSHATVLWAPFEQRAGELKDLGADHAARFVCVESANCGPLALRLGPGDTHSLTTVITVTPSPVDASPVLPDPVIPNSVAPG